MSQPESKTDPVDKRQPRQRGKTKGRVVDLNALLEVQKLLGDAPRDRDQLIERCLFQGIARNPVGLPAYDDGSDDRHGRNRHHEF